MSVPIGADSEDFVEILSPADVLSPETTPDSPFAGSAAFDPPAQPQQPQPNPYTQESAYAGNQGQPEVNPYAQGVRPGPPLTPPGMRPHRGGLILGLGIASISTSIFLCCCFLIVPVSLGLGIPAIVMGNSDLSAIKRNELDPAGYSQTQAGMICGIIGCVLSGAGGAWSILSIIMSI